MPPPPKSAYEWFGGVMVRTLDLGSEGREFDSLVGSLSSGYYLDG